MWQKNMCIWPDFSNETLWDNVVREHDIMYEEDI